MLFTDRILRLLLAILFFVLYFSFHISGGWGIALLALGSLFFLNNFTGFCPVYWFFGLLGKKGI
jgi:hypothetical protein